ncbi:MAG: S26 family signal peptidase, partial [Thermoplasmata archaeon]|nr:S26 family signal peptidase [Thermoplasmata archaeon]
MKVGKSEKKEGEKGEVKQFFMDLLAVLIVLLIIFASLYTYLGRYPFVVVVKSGSMMHGVDSSIGVIDTGDLVFVKKVEGRGDIITFVEGREDGYKKFGSYGDVIIYKRNGDNSSIPIIHRAVVWIEVNLTSTRPSYDVPSLHLYNITTRFVIKDYGYRHRDIVVDVAKILAVFSMMRITPHSGFITKGDNNLFVDQNSNFTGPVPHI